MNDKVRVKQISVIMLTMKKQIKYENMITITTLQQ